MAWGTAQDLLDPTVARVIELVRRTIACGEDVPTFRRQPEQGACSGIWAVGDHEVAGLRREGDLLIDALLLPVVNDATPTNLPFPHAIHGDCDNLAGGNALNFLNGAAEDRNDGLTDEQVVQRLLYADGPDRLRAKRTSESNC
jgi:hypothetical protein